MSLTRRGLIGSLICAPAIIRTPGLIMPIKPLKKLAQFRINSVTFNGHTFEVMGYKLEEGEAIFLTMVSSKPYEINDIVMVEDLFA